MTKWDDYSTPFPAEPLDGYGDGGLYPVYVNDLFQNGRYRVLNKLGFGGYSTVWAAQDNRAQSQVSIKVIKAKYSENNTELRILEHFREDKTGHPGHQYLPRLLDYFYVDSSGRRNLFMVLELLGPNISDICYRLPLNRFGLSCEMPKQLLMAVDYLHRQGIVHGDIHEGNILFRPPKGYRQDLSKVIQGKVRRSDHRPLENGIPTCLVRPLEFDLDIADDELERFNHIVLIDFSTSFFVSDPPRTTHTVIHMSPPELIFRRPLGKPMDIWSLACTTYYLITGESLFNATGDMRNNIPQIYRVIGETSASWLLTALIDAVRGATWDGHLYFSDYDGYYILEEMLQIYHDISHDSGTIKERRSSEDAISFLRKALTADPSKRATTQELLAERWMLEELI